MMLSLYLKTSVREIICGIVMVVFAGLLFLFLPNERIDWKDFIYVIGLLSVTCILFFSVGFFTFFKRYKPLVDACSKQADLRAALPGDASFYSLLLSDVYKQMEEKQRVEREKRHVEATEKDEYIEQWVHDAKIPLAVCDLILAKESSSLEAKEQLTYEMERLKYLVNQVLYSTRISDMAQNLDITRFNVTNMLRKVVKMNALFFIQKDISLEFHMPDEVILSDEKWLSYILTQIIHNAAKYTKQQGVVLIHSERTKRELLIHVWNEGDGIRKEDLPKVFNKGFVGEMGRTQTKSTGIGLYLANSAATHLGVTIKALSKENQSAEFVVTIPTDHM
jgi:K+-sensing histidine kinase KdpD